jgi:hypothetical protein
MLFVAFFPEWTHFWTYILLKRSTRKNTQMYIYFLLSITYILNTYFDQGVMTYYARIYHCCQYCKYYKCQQLITLLLNVVISIKNYESYLIPTLHIHEWISKTINMDCFHARTNFVILLLYLHNFRSGQNFGHADIWTFMHEKRTNIHLLIF